MNRFAILAAAGLVAGLAAGDCLAQTMDGTRAGNVDHGYRGGAVGSTDTRHWDRGTYRGDRTHLHGDRTHWHGDRTHWHGDRSHWRGHDRYRSHYGWGGGWYPRHGWSSPAYGYPRWAYSGIYVPPLYYSYAVEPPVYVERVIQREPIYVERVVPREPIYVEREAPPPPPRSERPYAQVIPAPRTEPVKPPPERLERYTLSATELFEFDKATLKLPQPKLDEIADAMVRNPRIDNVTVTGHTDRIGTDAYNLKLSRQRAEAVKAYLVGKGVAPSRLVAVGKGEANPVVQCNDKDQAKLIKCLEPNRRVEVEQITVERRSTR